MKILHTADWHLGRRLHGQDLAPEQDAALDAILRIAREHRVDAIVHAGDVFDTGMPPQTALRQYYRFLARVPETGCGTVIITGGNHDSPASLNAPKDLLEALNIRVVGGATEDIADEVIPIRNSAGTVLGYCCAVPFLRDKDLRYSLPGESETERQKRIIAGMRGHYENVVAAAKRINTENLPLIATGHLFAQGGITGDLDSKEQIHVGNLGQIGADAFPNEFSYIALGHLHRPQIVGKREFVRYSGSPVALDFSERDDQKHVVIVECSSDSPAKVEIVSLPVTRRLVRFLGDIAEVENAIVAFQPSEYALPTFAEVHLPPQAKTAIMDANEHFRAFAAGKHGEKLLVLRVVQDRAKGVSGFDNYVETSLQELSRKDVFAERLKKSGLEGNEAAELQTTFTELLTLLDEGAILA
ncbi:MAG: exonuclease subunit SbcD [Candidatus Kapabacteria bacterium]|jgi:exonuclease SbcD|nr:exonuclease subunit SbcD [Candidatus Kapabacteria bacterium]